MELVVDFLKNSYDILRLLYLEYTVLVIFYRFLKYIEAQKPLLY